MHLDASALFHDEVNGPVSHLHDPRQAYLQRIFFPGRFSVETLSKAVSVSRSWIAFIFRIPARFNFQRC